MLLNVFYVCAGVAPRLLAEGMSLDSLSKRDDCCRLGYRSVIKCIEIQQRTSDNGKSTSKTAHRAHSAATIQVAVLFSRRNDASKDEYP